MHDRGKWEAHLSRHSTSLKEQAGGTRVPAVIDDLLPHRELFTAEEQWCLARIEILRGLSSARVDRSDWPQSVHWSWAYKAALLGPTRFEESGDVRVFGIESSGRWQGPI